ncbi:MAG: histidine phosphatase family protein [Oscillospiraceae bacterium]|nr:histidine phosphatase family protein [Oscillospiraceae bacterium]
MSILITRHGQTDWNVEHRVQGQADIDLNETGRKQAEEVRERLLGESIDLIISSPLKRAKHTADAINRGRNIRILYDDRIAERNFGVLEGKRREDFDFREFWSYERNVQYERAEDIRTFFSRVYGFLEDIGRTYGGKNILLVAHGGVSIPVNCYFRGIPKTDDLYCLALENCQYAKYEFDKREQK